MNDEVLSYTKWDRRFLELARLVSGWSKDPSTKVGAVIVRPDKTVASLGFNGFCRNMHDDPAHYTNREEKYSRVIHAEMNALLHCPEKTNEYTMYSTLLPCDRCFVVLAQAGIERFVTFKPTQEQETRWGESFNKTRKYVGELLLRMDEYDIEDDEAKIYLERNQ